jgi:hypothetical protein
MQEFDSNDSNYDSDSSLVSSINKSLKSVKEFRKRISCLRNKKFVEKVDRKENTKIPNSHKSDLPTIRNVQTIASVFIEKGYLNDDGSVFPMTPENLVKYIIYQTNRMEQKSFSISSLNWYLQSLRRYSLDTGLEWETLRQSEIVKNAMTRARKIASDLKKKESLESSVEMADQ